MIEIHNRKINDYKIEEILDAGIILKGMEIKSLADKEADLTGSYIIIRDKPILVGSYIKVRENSFSVSYEAQRDRSLLLTKSQIRYVREQQIKGKSVIPIKFFTAENGKIKLKFAISTPLKKYDRRSRELKKEHLKEMA